MAGLSNAYLAVSPDIRMIPPMLGYRVNLSGLVIGVLLVILSSTGCAAVLYSADQFTFARNGEYACYVQVASTTEWPMAGSRIIEEQANLILWRQGHDTLQKVPLLRAKIKSHSDSLKHNIKISFSPDSKHLLVLSPQRASCLESSSAKEIRVYSGWNRLYSGSWVSDEKFALVVSQARTTDSGERKREIQTRDIAGDTNGDLLPDTFSDEEFDSWGGEDRVGRDGRYIWSPQGRYLVLRPTARDPWKIIDMQTKQIRDVGGAGANASSVSWAEDESQVLLASWYRSDAVFRGTVIRLPSFESREVGEALTKALVETQPGLSPLQDPHSLPDDPSPAIAPLWTTTGRWVVLNAIGKLWSPERDKVLDIEEELTRHGITVGPFDRWIRRLVVPGWLLVRTSVKGSPRYFAVPDDFTSVVPLEEIDLRGTGSLGPDALRRVVSPDGRLSFAISGNFSHPYQVKSLSQSLSPRLASKS